MDTKQRIVERAERTDSVFEGTPMTYPETKRVSVVDEHFGVKIADSYRWLANDVRHDSDVAAWINAQNGLARSYFAKLPSRDVFRKRLTALFDHARLTAPHKQGDRYFFTRNAGLDNQAVLQMRVGAEGEEVADMWALATRWTGLAIRAAE